MSRCGQRSTFDAGADLIRPPTQAFKISIRLLFHVLLGSRLQPVSCTGPAAPGCCLSVLKPVASAGPWRYVTGAHQGRGSRDRGLLLDVREVVRQDGNRPPLQVITVQTGKFGQGFCCHVPVTRAILNIPSRLLAELLSVVSYSRQYVAMRFSTP